jgi:hypothetical protein
MVLNVDMYICCLMLLNVASHEQNDAFKYMFIWWNVIV